MSSDLAVDNRLQTGAYFHFVLKCGIRELPCCVRDAARPVLSQHVLNGIHDHGCDAIGFGQGRSPVEVPSLR